MDQNASSKLTLVATLCKPVVRFALKWGIGAYDLLEVLKSVYVELAAAEIRKRGETANVSRLSVMTGLQRKDVKRISAGETKMDYSSNLVTRVLNRWEQDSRFLTAAGKPKVLTFQGEGSELEILVKLVSTDVGPKAVLAELERLGYVERTKVGIKLLAPVHFLTASPEKGLNLLAHDTEALITAVEQNLFTAQEVRNLHISTEYDNIFEDDLPTIRKWLFEQGQLFHKKAREFLSGYDKDVSPNPRKSGGAKVSLVAFSLTSKPRND